MRHFLITAKNIKMGYIDYKCSQEYVLETEYSMIMSRSLPKIGDVLITTEAPCGNVAQIDRTDIALAQRVIKYRGKEKIIDNTFLNYNLLTQIFQNYLITKASGGTVKGIKGSVLHRLLIKFPTLPKQTKIGNFFKQLDELIALCVRELNNLKQTKQGFLQKMFPKDGARVPEIRFAGFSEDWEEKKLGDIFDYERPDKYIVLNSEYLDSNITPVLTANKSFIIGYTHETKTCNKESIIFDDFTLDSKFVDFAYMVKSSAIKILTAKEGNNLRFAFELLNSTTIEILGHARHYISIVQPTKTLTPFLQEQTKIGNFFKQLDDIIALQQKELDNLKQTKKAFLQKMFV